MIDNHNQNVSSIWNFKQKKSHQLPTVADVVIIGGGGHGWVLLPFS